MQGDYVLGRKLLEECYRGVLGYFIEYSKENSAKQDCSDPPADEKSAPEAPRASLPFQFTGHWSDGLIEYIRNPSHPAVYYHDNDVVIVNDKFPKAQQHLLIVPKNEMKGYKSLDKASVPLLRAMIKHAERVAKE